MIAKKMKIELVLELISAKNYTSIGKIQKW